LKEFINAILNFLSDNNKNFISKALLIILGLALIILIDNITGFSFHYNTEKKIEEIERLNVLEKNVTDSVMKTYIINTRNTIINKRNFQDYLSSSFNRTATINTTINTDEQTINDTNKSSNIKSNYIFYLSAGGLYFLLAILGSMLSIILGDNKIHISQRIATAIMLLVIIPIFGILLILLSELIPKLSPTTWFWNYLVNLILQLSSFGFMIYASQKK
jgi:hypothetical protein